MQTHVVAWWLAGFCTILSVLFSASLVLRHLKHYHTPHLQKYVVRIVLMVPVYACASFLSLTFPHATPFFDLIREVYESVVVYSFFTMLVTFASNQGSTPLGDILKEKASMSHPTPCCCFGNIGLGPTFLRRCWLGVLQYILVGPVIAFLALCFHVLGRYRKGRLIMEGTYVYLVFTENISVSTAMYALLYFYSATKDIIAPLNPVNKFISVKLVVFATFWQGLTLSILKATNVIHDTDMFSASDVQFGTQNFIICLEMVAFAVLHHRSFGYEDFVNADTLEREKQQYVLAELAEFAYAPGRTVVQVKDSFMHMADPKDIVHNARAAIGTELHVLGKRIAGGSTLVSDAAPGKGSSLSPVAAGKSSTPSEGSIADDTAGGLSGHMDLGDTTLDIDIPTITPPPRPLSSANSLIQLPSESNTSSPKAGVSPSASSGPKPNPLSRHKSD